MAKKQKIQEIFNDELTVRRHLSWFLFQQKNISDEMFARLIQGFSDPDSVSEIKKIQMALATGKSPKPPFISSPNTQFLWGLTLAYLSNKPNIMASWENAPTDQPPKLEQFPIWKQVAGSLRAKKELLVNIVNAGMITDNSNLKILWSPPGTGTHYIPSKNLVAIDLIETLISGFEHGRSHSVARINKGFLTKSYTPKMNELFKQINQLKQKQANQKNHLSKEDYKELRTLYAEWYLRRRFYDAVERSLLFQSTAELSDLSFQDFSESLNIIATSILGMSPKEDEIEPQQKKSSKKRFETSLEEFNHLEKVLNMIFFEENGLFKDNIEGWHSIGLYPEKVRRINSRNDKHNVLFDFKELLRMIRDTKKGIQHAKPSLQQKNQGNDYFEYLLEEENKKRNKLIERLWKQYAKDLVQEILEHDLDQLENEMEQKAQDMLQNNEDVPNDPSNQQQNAQDQQAQQEAMKEAIDGMLEQSMEKMQDAKDKIEDEKQSPTQPTEQPQEQSQQDSLSNETTETDLSQEEINTLKEQLEKLKEELSEMQDSSNEQSEPSKNKQDNDKKPQSPNKQEESKESSDKSDNTDSDHSSDENDSNNNPTSEQQENLSPEEQELMDQIKEMQKELQKQQNQQQQDSQKPQKQEEKSQDPASDSSLDQSSDKLDEAMQKLQEALDQNQQNQQDQSNESLKESIEKLKEALEELKNAQEEQSSQNKDDAQQSMEEALEQMEQLDQAMENSQEQQNQQDGQEQDGQQQQQGQQQGQQQQGQQQQGQQQSGQQDGQENGNVDVDGVGEMPDVDTPGQTPEEQSMKEMGQDPGEGQDGQDQDGQTADDLSQDISDMESGNDADGQGQDADNGDDSLDSNEGSASEGSKDIDIAKGSWENYKNNIQQLSGSINRVAKLLQKIKDKQVQYKKYLSKKKDILPPGGEIHRLDRKAHRDLIVKEKSGQQIKAKDRERFRIDRKKEDPTTVDIILLIDGSGSMTMNSGNQSTRMQAALSGAAIIREACKKVGGLNVHVGIWGDSTKIYWIAQPNDSDKKVGKGFEEARNGINSGTEFTPAIRLTAKKKAEERIKGSKRVGHTHIMVISDGDLNHNDGPPAASAIHELLKHSPETTIDFAVINQRDNETKMEELAKKLKAPRKKQKIDVTRETNFSKFPLEMVKLLFKKVGKNKSFIAIPSSKKKQGFRKAYKNIKKAGPK